MAHRVLHRVVHQVLKMLVHKLHVFPLDPIWSRSWLRHGVVPLQTLPACTPGEQFGTRLPFPTRGSLLTGSAPRATTRTRTISPTRNTTLQKSEEASVHTETLGKRILQSVRHVVAVSTIRDGQVLLGTESYGWCSTFKIIY